MIADLSNNTRTLPADFDQLFLTATAASRQHYWETIGCVGYLATMKQRMIPLSGGTQSNFMGLLLARDRLLAIGCELLQPIPAYH